MQNLLRLGSLRWVEDLAAHRPSDESDATCSGVEAVALFSVCGQHRLDGVRRKCLAQFGAHNPVSVARPDHARINMVPGDRHKPDRVFSQDRFRPGSQA